MIALLLAASLLDAGPSDKLALRPVADFTIVGVGFAGFVIPELLKQDLAPQQCQICGPPNAVDGWFHDRVTGWLMPRRTADNVSSLWAFVVLPVGALASAAVATGPYASDGAGFRAAVIVLESSAVAVSAIQSIKFFAARQRPFAAYGDGDASGAYSLSDRDSHLSMPSGHTAFATALGVSVAMTATLEESPAAPWLWAAAGVASASTGMLRMMAEKHYFTDALSGAAIGAGCGVLFPLLHRRGSALSVAANGPSVALSGAF